MKRKISSLISLLLFLSLTVSAKQKPENILVSDKIKLTKLSENVYLHVSYLQTENYGKVGANGLLLVKNGEALVIDTPWNDSQAEELFNWVKDSLHATISTVIPSHSHEDSMGGLAYFQSKNVKSYAGQKTIDIAKEKNLPVPKCGFTDSLVFKFQNILVECYYPGKGHSPDNIVVWLPTEGILFGGDVVKDTNSQNLGSLTDADTGAWPITLKRVSERFPNAKIIVPGHGSIGRIELIEHTEKLLEK